MQVNDQAGVRYGSIITITKFRQADRQTLVALDVVMMNWNKVSYLLYTVDVKSRLRRCIRSVGLFAYYLTF